MMKRLYLQLKKTLLLLCSFIVCSLVLVKDAPAPPGPPPPPVPAGGDVAQAVVIGAIAAYGAWRIWKRK